jgi:dienelactone hydrolase
MKTIFLLVMAAIFSFNTYAQKCNGITWSSVTDPGPYNWTTMVEADGLRNGPDYNGATVYYPMDAAPPYACVVLSPGYWSDQSSVADWGPFYASHGYIAMTIGTNEPWEYPESRAEGILDAMETLRQENTRATSPLLGKIDTERFVASGWSMGGGGAQRAAAMDDRVKAIVALTPWLIIFSNSEVNHNAPLLILSGEEDNTAPPSNHADVHYNRTPATTNKLKFEVAGDGHHAADGAYGANGDLGKTVISWLKYHLYNELCYCPLFSIPPNTASQYITNVTCGAVTSTGEAVSAQSKSISVYPNPASDRLVVEAALETAQEYKLYSSLGQCLLSGTISGTVSEIDISALSPDVYYLCTGGTCIKLVKTGDNR